MPQSSLTEMVLLDLNISISPSVSSGISSPLKISQTNV
jgi:hypothetical protein